MLLGSKEIRERIEFMKAQGMSEADIKAYKRMCADKQRRQSPDPLEGPDWIEDGQTVYDHFKGVSRCG